MSYTVVKLQGDIMLRGYFDLLKHNAGTVTIEYALIATIISIIALSSFFVLGTAVSGYIGSANSGFSR